MKSQSLKISLVLTLSFYGLGSCSTVVENPAALDSPNVIIMLADDLGWADVGYRGSDIKTPNIDQLAADGLRLERFYTCLLYTSPSPRDATLSRMPSSA